jgi:hypothetical protein
MRRWLVGGLRSEVSEANETKQATHQPLTAICDVTGIIFYFSMRFSIIHLNLKLYFRF